MPLSARSIVLVAAVALAVCIAYDQLGAGLLRRPAPTTSPALDIFRKAAA